MNGTLRQGLAMSALTAVLSLAGGCSNKPLQDRNPTGAGGIGSLDAGLDHVAPTTDAAPPDATPPTTDAAPPDAAPPLTGLRSFVVTSQLLQSPSGVPLTPTPAHVFTMVLDGDRSTAIAGAGDRANVLPFEPAVGGALRIVGSAHFNVPLACTGSSIDYNDLRFTIDANGGLTGTGQGSVTTFHGDYATTSSVTMSLTGVADTQPPTLAMTGDAVDPFASFSMVSSEPLLPSASAVLRAVSGETDTLDARGMVGSFVTGFYKPVKMLRYATQYQITLDGIMDFAGNAATIGSGPTFTTRPLPPLAVEDGFESVTDTSFAGAQVLSGAGAPTITGAKSLYIAPASSSGIAQSQLLLRLPVAAGDTMVRFAYRAVKLGQSPDPAPSRDTSWVLGSANGQIEAPSLTSDTGTTTIAMIGNVGVTLGPVTTATFTLPAGAASDVVIQRTSRVYGGCDGLPPPSTGIIIDDLRAE